MLRVINKRIKLQTGWTPLMIACKNGLLEIAKLLVEAIKKLPDAEKQKALDQTKEVNSHLTTPKLSPLEQKPHTSCPNQYPLT